MKLPLKFDMVEESIIQDKNFICTIASYSVILAIFMNLNSLGSPLIGLIASIIYSIINAVFLGNAFFEKENAFFRLVFGVLLLIMLLGFVGWIIMIIYNLDVFEFTLVLLVTTTLSSLSNRRMRHKNATF
jgi:uncharacterized membrane protein YfcA